MPRPPRHDLHPVIWIQDTSEDERRARQVIRPRLSVSVYERNGSTPFVRHFGAFDNWVRWLRGENETIDHEVLNCMVGHLPFADARPQVGLRQGALVAHILFTPGCRVQMYQHEIANELNCSAERVRKAIKQLKRCEIIINTGKGWYEFDADFFWKGNESYRIAYTSIQNKWQLW